MRWLAFAFVILPACGPAAYSVGGVARTGDVDARAVRTLGCLDVGVAVKPAFHDDDAALLVLRVGNRCLRPAAFDVRAASIVGVTVDGRTSPLELVDPRAELIPVHVDAGAQGIEKIRLRAREPGELRRLCIDLGHVAPEVGVVDARVCFTNVAGWQVSS